MLLMLVDNKKRNDAPSIASIVFGIEPGKQIR
jgi:hypothetical protein